MSSFFEGFEKRAISFSLTEAGVVGALGAGAGALYGGERKPGSKVKVNRRVGALRGAVTGAGMSAGYDVGHQLAQGMPGGGRLGGLLGGVVAYNLARKYGPQYDKERLNK